jgi:hypothetical protein
MKTEPARRTGKKGRRGQYRAITKSVYLAMTILRRPVMNTLPAVRRSMEDRALAR